MKNVVNFRFAETDVICRFVEELDEDKVNELCDSIQSYMDGFIGDNEYSPIDVLHTVLSESGLGDYEIIDPEYIVFVE